MFYRKNKKENNLLMKLNKIQTKDLKNMEKVYRTYSKWLIENGPMCKDNKQIDEKQKELEKELGVNITNLITDHYHITRSLSIPLDSAK